MISDRLDVVSGFFRGWIIFAVLSVVIVLSI